MLSSRHAPATFCALSPVRWRREAHRDPKPRPHQVKGRASCGRGVHLVSEAPVTCRLFCLHNSKHRSCSVAGPPRPCPLPLPAAPPQPGNLGGLRADGQMCRKSLWEALGLHLLAGSARGPRNADQTIPEGPSPLRASQSAPREPDGLLPELGSQPQCLLSPAPPGRPHTTQAASAAEEEAAGALRNASEGTASPSWVPTNQGGQIAFRLTSYPFPPAALLHLLAAALSTPLPLFWGALPRGSYCSHSHSWCALSSPSSSPYSTRGSPHTLSVACFSVSLPLGAHPTPLGSPRPAWPDKNSVLSPRKPQTQGQEMHKQKHSPFPAAASPPFRTRELLGSMQLSPRSRCSSQRARLLAQLGEDANRNANHMQIQGLPLGAWHPAILCCLWLTHSGPESPGGPSA